MNHSTSHSASHSTNHSSNHSASHSTSDSSNHLAMPKEHSALPAIIRRSSAHLIDHPYLWVQEALELHNRTPQAFQRRLTGTLQRLWSGSNGNVASLEDFYHFRCPSKVANIGSLTRRFSSEKARRDMLQQIGLKYGESPKNVTPMQMYWYWYDVNNIHKFDKTANNSDTMKNKVNNVYQDKASIQQSKIMTSSSLEGKPAQGIHQLGDDWDHELTYLCLQTAAEEILPTLLNAREAMKRSKFIRYFVIDIRPQVLKDMTGTFATSLPLDLQALMMTVSGEDQLHEEEEDDEADENEEGKLDSDKMTNIKAKLEKAIVSLLCPVQASQESSLQMIDENQPGRTTLDGENTMVSTSSNTTTHLVIMGEGSLDWALGKTTREKGTSKRSRLSGGQIDNGTGKESSQPKLDRSVNAREKEFFTNNTVEESYISLLLSVLYKNNFHHVSVLQGGYYALHAAVDNHLQEIKSKIRGSNKTGDIAPPRPMEDIIIGFDPRKCPFCKVKRFVKRKRSRQIKAPKSKKLLQGKDAIPRQTKKRDFSLNIKAFSKSAQSLFNNSSRQTKTKRGLGVGSSKGKSLGTSVQSSMSTNKTKPKLRSSVNGQPQSVPINKEGVKTPRENHEEEIMSRSVPKRSHFSIGFDEDEHESSSSEEEDSDNDGYSDDEKVDTIDNEKVNAIDNEKVNAIDDEKANAIDDEKVKAVDFDKEDPVYGNSSNVEEERQQGDSFSSQREHGSSSLSGFSSDDSRSSVDVIRRYTTNLSALANEATINATTMLQRAATSAAAARNSGSLYGDNTTSNVKGSLETPSSLRVGNFISINELERRAICMWPCWIAAHELFAPVNPTTTQAITGAMTNLWRGLKDRASRRPKASTLPSSYSTNLTSGSSIPAQSHVIHVSEKGELCVIEITSSNVFKQLGFTLSKKGIELARLSRPTTALSSSKANQHGGYVRLCRSLADVSRMTFNKTNKNLLSLYWKGDSRQDYQQQRESKKTTSKNEKVSRIVFDDPSGFIEATREGIRNVQQQIVCGSDGTSSQSSGVEDTVDDLL
eukprot:g4012.t1